MNDVADTPMLDFAANDARAGFRLHRFEVYNWGTFDGRVWVHEPHGDNSLLTGDIGSGKSTLVDALTTLLVPAQRIVYNKAAGAEVRERSLRSYVLGYYKSERGESGLSSRAIALRDNNSYSVVLAHFHNEGYDSDVTLAQVFWMRDTQGQPARFYVVARESLTIQNDFADFGSDIAALRKRLRAREGVEVHDTFPPYGASFRRLFGIDNEQALELFNQTVSMKSVGNLTEFVRSHMLEPFPVEARIAALITHFDDLDRAHAAVVKAREQIAALQPLVDDADRFGEIAAELDTLRNCREALKPWFASLKTELLAERIVRLTRKLETLDGKIRRLDDSQRTLNTRRDDIRQAIREHGGDRLERLRYDIDALTRDRDNRRHKDEAYAALARSLALPDARDEAVFHDNRAAATQALAELRSEEADLDNSRTALLVESQADETRHAELQQELASLRQRRSNIPGRMLELRERLCEALGVSAKSLPFAGELLQVRDDERDWEGAIERLLHNFGLSLLVPDAHYRAVADWVDRTRLRGRLVYFRVVERRDVAPEAGPDSLVRKVAIRADSAFYGWLESELARRFDFACCADLDQFRRERKAVTRAGQVKTSGERHEKDDRHAIDDRTRYVLGWSNEAKIAALAEQAGAVQGRLTATRGRLGDMDRQRGALRERADGLNRLTFYSDFRELDWRPLTLEIQTLEEERRALAAASDVLRTLQERLQATEQESAQVEQQLKALGREHAVDVERREVAEREVADLQILLDATPAEAKVELFPRLEALRGEALGEHRLTLESCDNRRGDMREWLQARIDNEQRRLERLRERIVVAMNRYRNQWPAETGEVDASIDAIDEYRAMLEQLRADDLPRFESRFKELLNEQTIREVANFQAQLHREREVIRERIATINRSLRDIDYNPGRYINLQAELAADVDVREFRDQLRTCTEGAITGSDDEQYSEAKFLQVRQIIDRFRGREGQTELDQRWTRKVTDVRNWFAFSASERWREDDTEHEHYTDSGGKSGGQKEKLAYTVLAASLAYQFGLEWGEQRSRSFRFVVIDEAFGRGSDESSRYGLELFRRLNLQLLIVTPLQKIHVIEPFVANVGFVHNEDGRQSMLRGLSIEEYRAERRARGLIQVS